ncbi:DUF1800 domain-containing protein [Chitinophaga parva]|uniref:DUF1800 domain-containing protein n=1 Tax=Chitinophaga parva TaxID=2169414 RepID=A0A2T7BQB5_9BACT|nr:DUF1800 domain-containing protein [Chitinophaga parva]
MQHLAWRAGFGETMPVITDWQNKRRNELVNKIVMGPAKAPLEPLYVIHDTDMPDYSRNKDMSTDQRKEIRQMNEQAIRDLNVSWMLEMIGSPNALREKMALFWHGHFACRTQNVFFNQQLLQVIRENALGNFADLLTAVSKSAAMLQFLNNQQNRKQHPNENFAREVMELFTMGRGHYSEQDVKEAARAFTGWGFDDTGTFVFRKNAHDEGRKTVLGKTGNFDGDDVLKILCEQEQTARFITRKIYAYFVNDQVDEDQVNKLAHKFYTSSYDIHGLMQHIFTSDFFYDNANVGNRIKSPVELLVGIRRTIPMLFDQEEVMLLFQRIMGQLLFYPPNVAGWPGGRAWIDSSSLMFRMRVPQVILYSQTLSVMPKELVPEMGEGQHYKATLAINDFLKRQYAKKINARINWEPYLSALSAIPRESLAPAIAQHLLGANNLPSALLDKYADAATRESYIKTVTIDVMSTPEYQLC